ncbi:hypothetical protein BDM02DRAFT_3192471 [Thelephora ganbajun]|uniref:Uncharacterized protein n=1 Tax=Thelephora ganbajun TaxID=370292 RepID=A0ACB6YZM7_THEGA|nr:hypothetical protein BDM02DRAFT_3192471 [Thelephora ganbajun]
MDFGCPYRIRGDKGLENIDLCTWMIMFQGPNRASFMWGKSTHNTRIERLWLESGQHFARGWRAFFTHLEQHHSLERDNPHHIWLLHTLFLEDIQHDCDEFCLDWNSHPLSGKGQNMSPLDIWLLGQTQHGIYDEAGSVDPALLHRYYGAAIPHANDRSNGNSSNDMDSDSDPTSNSDSDSTSDSGGDPTSDSDGDSSNDEDHEVEVELGDGNIQSWQEIARVIASAQRCNIRHDTAKVASSAMPFESRGDMQAYILALHNALASNKYPTGFGLNMEYNSVVSYKTGHSSKLLTIPLPYEVWFPHIVIWCKALDLLKHLSVCKAAVVLSE